MEDKKFKDLSYKDKASYVSAIASLCLGWGLLIAGFIVPPLGVIDATVLTVFGTVLIYAAAIFGIALYINDKTSIIQKMMNTFREQMEHRFEEQEKRLKNNITNDISSNCQSPASHLPANEFVGLP